MRFDGRVAIVTGAGSGIGEATARLLSAEGAAVALFGRHKGNISRVASSLPRERTMVRVVDVSKPRLLEGAVEAVARAFGRLDILVNNAGIFAGGNATRTRPDQWDEVMATDAGSVFHGSRAAIPHLLRTRGCIVNVASVSGLGADWEMTAYNAAKGAVVNLTRAMAIDYAKRGVRVNAVCPSFTLTKLTEKDARKPAVMKKVVERMPIGRIAMPDDIAPVIAFLASDDARFVTGVNLPVDGGVTASNGQANMA